MISENRKMRILTYSDRKGEPSLLICPACGRIGKYHITSEGDRYLLAKKEICPFCDYSYTEAEMLYMPEDGEMLEQYNRSPGLYNAAAKRNFLAKKTAPAEQDVHTDEKITRWKKELLDTGMRNRLVNFRETRSGSLKLTEPSSEVLFDTLAVKEKELSFARPVSRLSDYRTYAVLALMDTLSYPMPAETGDIRTEGTVSEREKTLKNLQAKTRMAREEQGINILYAAFGFVLWRDPARGHGKWIKSPLLMMPVSLTRKKMTDPFLIRKGEDEITVNPTLSYLFETEYDLKLPPFTLSGKDSYRAYLQEVSGLIEGRGWKAVDETWLGLFSFLKISMYHDLEQNTARMKEHPVIQAMCEDTGLKEQHLPQENIDLSDPADWHEVVDADSSQEEAILLYKKGVSFVMQGPPGTGKSQTITNIIAEALADGKKVLFVSEKAAALQVVHKRLAEADLDDFCLSLHNYRADRKKTVSEIEKNLRLKPEPEESYIARDLKNLFQERSIIRKYAEELHEKKEPLQESIYSMFGRLASLENNTDLSFRMENIGEISADRYTALLNAAEGYENALHRLGGKMSENPWSGTALNDSSQAVRQRLRQEWGDLPASIDALNAMVRNAEKTYHLSFGETEAELEKTIPEAITVLSLPLYPAGIRTASLNRLIKEAEENGKRYRFLTERKQKLQTALGQTESVWHTDRLKLDEKQLNALYQTLEDDAYPVNSLADLKKEEERLHHIQRLTEHMNEACRTAGRILSLEGQGTGEELLRMARVLQILSAGALPEENWFHPVHAKETLKLADEAEKQLTKIRQMEASLPAEWDPMILKINAEGMLRRFRTEYTGLLYMLKGNYRADMRELRGYHRNAGQNVSDAEAQYILQYVHEINLEKAWFEDNREKLRAAFGRYEDGMHTDLNQIRDGVAAAHSLSLCFPLGSLPSGLIRSVSDLNDRISDAAAVRSCAEVLSEQAVNELFEKIGTLGAENPMQLKLEEDMIPLVNRQKERLFLCRAALQIVRRAVKKEKIMPGEIRRLSEDITEIIRLIKESGEEVPSRIPSVLSVASDLLARTEEEIGQLEPEEQEKYAFLKTEEKSSWRGFADTLKKIRFYEQSSLPELYGDLRNQLRENPQKQKTILLELKDIQNVLNDVRQETDLFQAVFPTDDMHTKKPAYVKMQAEACLADFDALDRYLDVKEAEKECDALGLSGLSAAVKANDYAVKDVKAAFEKRFAAEWLAFALKEADILGEFRRRSFDQKAEKFCRLDRKQFRYNRQRIRDRVISSFPDRNTVTSETAVLLHEAEKKRRIMPLRRLFREIPHLLLQLKPCLMMSPLSVAYFLNADDYHFDLVIFDEASQIFPQDAIGAILRADQVIIAGDTKQLPPTDFFSRSTISAETEEDKYSYEETYDSILAEASAVLPGKMLLWHYRSRSEELISFSNRNIYHNELITFPSALSHGEGFGTEFVYVADGYYEPGGRNRNLPEAKKCVELMRENFDRWPERSLGIIAFSEKQQQAILREVQRFREEHPEYEPFFKEDSENAFFVKNLETVQGDERDTIIFSVGYAKTKEQKKTGRPMSMQFGPLSQAGGEYRLNVAVTRARMNIRLVSSVLPADFKDDVSSEGVRMLKEYMSYVIRHGSSDQDPDLRRKKDAFADGVSRYLNENGYETVRNAGSSDVRIDIAVRHPSLPGMFAAAVECDGYNYISGHTVRERERLRTDVLKNMGWHVYRIRPAEWLRSEEAEGAALLKFIAEAAVEMKRESVKGDEHE